jgi:thiol-disulfide isomerase/thioredoxin
MSTPAKGLKRLLEPRINLAVALGVLVALLALGPILFGVEGLFAREPLKRLATGEMAKFSFKHRGSAAPQVVFEGPEGEMTLARLKGSPLLVNLWASWCQPCIKELPSLERLQASLAGEGLRVVAINMDQNPDDALAFLAERKIRHLSFYRDRNLLMSIAWQEPGIPASVLYDEEGREVGRLVGAADWSSPEAKALIKAAIAGGRHTALR